jgi:hypothetical protein
VKIAKKRIVSNKTGFNNMPPKRFKAEANFPMIGLENNE